MIAKKRFINVISSGVIAEHRGRETGGELDFTLRIK
jgi:hypothetical protein